MKKFNKSIMISSGILNGILGIALTFLPQEIGGWLGMVSQTGAGTLALQLLGGALFGFGLINYTGRNAIYGGIYGKPILLGNLAFHFITGLELIRYMFDVDQFGFLLVAAMLYSFLAAAFIRMNFTSAV